MAQLSAPSGPLVGLRVVELAGIGPAPFAAMMLADYGAEVIRVERVGYTYELGHHPDLLYRGRRSVGVDLKTPEGLAVVYRLLADADVLLEGFRPGVTERLGVGPDDCLAHNPKLVYGRVTGWGREGPYAPTAGHDINYIALAGALHQFGYADSRPAPPVNLVADMGGGGMLLAAGVLAALWQAQRTGRGQVVDAAMVDGAALMMISVFSMLAAGQWVEARGANVSQGAAPFYGVYETADGEHICFAAAESAFYAEFLRVLGLEPESWDDHYNPSNWPERHRALAAIFRTKTRDEWTAQFEGGDACFAPVLSPTEATKHPHNVARGTFEEMDGIVQPAPAPRFSATPARIRSMPPRTGEHTDQVLTELGYGTDELAALRAAGAVG